MSRTSTPAWSEIERGQAEYAGCIHIHSAFSDGSGSYIDIVGAARNAGLDFVVLTDHCTLRPVHHGLEDWYGPVLLLAGAEYGRHKGHVLALDIQRTVRDWPADTRHICRQVLRQGGLAFVAHPGARGKRLLLRRDNSWRSPNMPLVTGLEVWSWMYDWFDGLTWQGSYPSAYLWPQRRISGPPESVLNLWDRLSNRRRCVGIGCLDAHAVKKWWLPGVEVFSYDYLFHTVRTHILASPPSGRASVDKAALYAALGRGRAFFAHHGHGDARGFRVAAKYQGRWYQMGDEIEWQGGEAEMHVRSPVAAQIHVLRGGRVTCTVPGTKATVHISNAGVYRVEAWRAGRPWVFANPICFRAGGCVKGTE